MFHVIDLAGVGLDVLKLGICHLALRALVAVEQTRMRRLQMGSKLVGRLVPADVRAEGASLNQETVIEDVTQIALLEHLLAHLAHLKR